MYDLKLRIRKSLSLFFLLILIFAGQQLYATHIRAGEITAKRLSGLEYEFTITIYTDTSSSVSNSVATVNFGDGTPEVNAPLVANTKYDGYGTEINVYTINHIYSGPGVYTVSYKEFNRNCSIINFNNTGCQTPFYVETRVSIDVFLGTNSSPVLLIPPIDRGAIGRIFTHNPGAFDPDGDSLVYRLGIPKIDANTNVFNYIYPNAVGPNPVNIDGGPATFTLDPRTGDLEWNAPVTAGNYNVVIFIDEYRDGLWIGSVMRDMQILVKPNPNRPPEITLPPDTCVTAGLTLDATISVDDPDNDKVIMSAYGGPFKQSGNIISFTPTTPQTVIAEGKFSWKTSCANVRRAPYQINFKAEDQVSASLKLADIKTWSVAIKGPRITGLKATPQSTKMLLTWNSYICTSNAESIKIYRKNCKGGFSSDSCSAGVDPSSGYEQIGQIAANLTSFLDDNEGKGLVRGIEYCYVLSVEFKAPAEGESKPTDEICANVPLDIPIGLNVSVTNTDTKNGKVLVRWLQPRDLDTLIFKGKFAYNLMRSDGVTSTNVYNTFNLQDTVYTDSLLNTVERTYAYWLDFRYDIANNNPLSGKLKGTSDSAYTIIIESAPGNQSVKLEWQTLTPWINTGAYHYIFRKTDTTNFILIDSVLAVSEKVTYTDRGIKEKNNQLVAYQTYSYYVTTIGRYVCPGEFKTKGLPSRLLNNSRIIQETPVDSLPPCPPLLSITPINCDSFLFDLPLKNHLWWQNIKDLECESDINGYNLYVADDKDQPSVLLQRFDNKTDTLFNHITGNLARCYEVTAFDITPTNKYLESAKSNRVCNDNCPLFELPNVFTPNGDGINDAFSPKPIPRFVKKTNTIIYNRWGRRVFEQEQQPPINEVFPIWDGNNVPDGVYFYYITVDFYTFKPESVTKTFKGWVQIIR